MPDSAPGRVNPTIHRSIPRPAGPADQELDAATDGGWLEPELTDLAVATVNAIEACGPGVDDPGNWIRWVLETTFGFAPEVASGGPGGLLADPRELDRIVDIVRGIVLMRELDIP